MAKTSAPPYNDEKNSEASISNSSTDEQANIYRGSSVVDGLTKVIGYRCTLRELGWWNFDDEAIREIYPLLVFVNDVAPVLVKG